ncbi:hypothetical protein B0H14DRAFT_3436414 [Mycena olivaceomarginata]|nr:hypothetical protein B0H14DRAFT_3436414 [Mycena olivaceomarginata]
MLKTKAFLIDSLPEEVNPFGTYKENPSWLAVKTFYDKVITTAPTHGQRPKGGAKSDLIHVTSTVYSAVLETLPDLHAQPLCATAALYASDLPPAPGGWVDLIVHVGVAGPAPLRTERLAHKTATSSRTTSGKAPHIIGRGNHFADELFTSIAVMPSIRDLTSGEVKVDFEARSWD